MYSFLPSLKSSARLEFEFLEGFQSLFGLLVTNEIICLLVQGKGRELEEEGERNLARSLFKPSVSPPLGTSREVMLYVLRQMGMPNLSGETQARIPVQ